MTKKINSEPENSDIEFVSKTEMKREMHAIQDFAAKICLMPKKKRGQLPVSDDITEAFVVADKIKDKPVAFKRHMNYMAKLLVEIDIDAIKKKIDFLENKHQQLDKKNQEIEKLRDTLIAGGDSAVQTLVEDNNAVDRQKLRQLVRQATKEHQSEKLGKHDKALLAYLKDVVN